jgi:hypothetical protein
MAASGGGHSRGRRACFAAQGDCTGCTRIAEALKALQSGVANGIHKIKNTYVG